MARSARSRIKTLDKAISEGDKMSLDKRFEIRCNDHQRIVIGFIAKEFAISEAQLMRAMIRQAETMFIDNPDELWDLILEE